MAIPKPFRLLIPRKTQKPVDQPGYGADMRAIEIWAQALVAYVDSLSGGGGITDITSTAPSTITVTSPMGPTTNLEVTGYPFLQYSDSHQNTGYGLRTFFVGVGAAGGNTAIGDLAMGTAFVSGSSNTAVGRQALTALSSGIGNVAIGSNALTSATTTNDNVAIGFFALNAYNGVDGNVAVGASALVNATGGGNVAVGLSAMRNVTSGVGNTGVGYGVNAAQSDHSYNTLLGFNTSAAADGGVAIGVDSAGTSAAAANANDFALGTASHVVVFHNNQTGGGSALLGANCPAVTPTAPYTWVKLRSDDGSIVYMPVWK